MKKQLDEAGVCEAYRQGASVKTLSKWLQIREAVIRDILARHGVERHPRGPQPVWRDPIGNARRASVLHLIDLKRAGHSPRQTELRIAPEYVVGRISLVPAAVHSSAGSPAAWCAEG